jgi:hypothetical protein
MKKNFVLVAVIFGLTILCNPQLSQAENIELYGLEPTIGVELPNLGYTTLRSTTPDEKCKDYSYEVGVAYPFGTGSAELDKILADNAALKLKDITKQDFDTCPKADDRERLTSVKRITFMATSPSKNYLSLLFTNFSFNPLDAHPSTTTEALVYDLRTAKTLELSDIFEDAPKIMPGLWTTVISAWCEKGHNTIPYYYEIEEPANTCGAEIPPLPDKFENEVIPFSSLGKVSLTPDGLTINLDPYEAWSYADGSAQIDISKQELINMGAHKEIWD